MKSRRVQVKKVAKRNRLWLARKRLGLGQKQVAYLLNLQTADQVSRYEKGLRTPTLKTALQLGIILGLPLHVLFQELFDGIQREICERINTNPTLKNLYAASPAEECCKEFCAFVEMMRIANLSGLDKAKLRDHITYLARKLPYL